MAKILLVDDDSDILALLKMTFEEVGHSVVCTKNSREVAQLTSRGDLDAIVLDIMMPEVSGWSVLARLKEQPATRSLPIIMLSALSDTSDRLRGLRGGADDYLTKPFEPEELVVRVERLISQKAFENAALQGRLEAHPLQETLQGLGQNSKSGVLEIFAETDSGLIVLEAGRLMAASFHGLSESEAVLALLEVKTGSFRFHPDPRKPSQEISGELLDLGPILIQGVWIEDELRKRKGLLPEATTTLELIKKPPIVPKNLPELPIPKIVQLLEEIGPVSLLQVLRQNIAAPNRVRLALAWFIEQEVMVARTGGKRMEVLRAAPAAEEPRAPELSTQRQEEWQEEFDMAVREFFQEALFRGFNLASEIRLSMMVEPLAWPQFSAYLQAVPPSFLDASTKQSRERLFQIRRGDMKLLHETGSLLLSVEPLAPHENPSLPSAKSVGIVFWLGENYSLEFLQQWVSIVHQKAPPKAGIVVFANALNTRQQLRNIVTSVANWRVPSDLPGSLSDAFLELTRTDVG